ncbi:MAG: ankyrin repeat domain-containing protein [Parachlamydiaceae bacterium]|nr:ankyrin repeat domain-containing protein [Parachlamydiaceae bacterium]
MLPPIQEMINTQSSNNLKEIPEHVSHIAGLFKIVADDDLARLEKRCIKAIVASFKTDQLTRISSCNQIYLAKLKDLSNKTLLIHAVKPGCEGLVTYLVKKEIGIHDTDKHGNTPLHYAVKRNAHDSIPLLLGHYNYNCINLAGETPLHIGIKAGKHKAVACILERYKDKHLPLIEDGIKLNPLALAVKYGQKECVNLLINKDLLFKDIGNLGTLLHVAVKYRQPEMVEYLLYSKKVIECLKAKNKSLKELIEKNNTENGLTPLNLAAQLGDLISIQLLFEKGASLETEDDDQNHPIHHAVKARQYETVQLLTMLGADLKAFGHEATTPIELVRHDKTSIGRSIFGFLSSAINMKKDYKVELHQRMAENHVFKGGGPKGIAYGGVVRYLAEKGILPLAKRFAGTSAGAFPVVFLGLNASVSKIEDLLIKTNITDYLDPPCSKECLLDLFHSKVDGVSSAIKATWNLLRSIRSTTEILFHPFETLKKLRNLTGICEGEEFREWAENEIKEMSGVEYFTFGELRKAIEIEGKPYKHMSIFGTRLQDVKNKSCSYKFSSEDPDCDNIIISDALRISMSIPGVFKPHTIHMKENGQRVSKPHLGQFVDGGLLNNLPMETFDYKGFISREELGIKGDFPVFNKRTIGYDLCSSPEDITDIKTDVKKVKTVFGLMKCLLEIYMEAEDNIRLLNPYASARIIKINVGTVGLLDFDLNTQQKEILLKSGYEATKKYFDNTIFQATQSSSSSTLLKAYKGYIALPPVLPEEPFDGRTELFLQLQNFCLPNGWTSKTNTPVALLTESEINTKEAALAFAHQHLNHFSIIKYIDCSTETSLIQGYQELADILHIFWNKETFVQDINRELETGSFTEKEEEKPWLLILDNVTTDIVEKISLPKNGGAILAISLEQKCIWPKDEVVVEIASFIDAKNVQKQTPLHRAAQSGREKNISYLLEQEENMNGINAVDLMNRTPLFVAIERGHFNVTELLLQKKADMTIISSDAKDSVLHVCAFNGDAKLLELLLKQPSSKDLINQGDHEGKTPLHKAVYRGKERSECVKLLCSYGANVLAANHFDYIPLHWSCMHGHLESTKILIQKKAPLDLTNANNESPFDLALREHEFETVHFLLKTKKRLPKIERQENQTFIEFYQQQFLEAEIGKLVEEQILYLIKISFHHKQENDLTASAQALHEAQKLQRTHLKNAHLERYLSNQLKEIQISNQLADPRLVEFGKKAPSYIYVAPGLNIEGICENKGCKAFNKVIWIQKGMDQFNIGEVASDINCPDCPGKKTALKINNLGFYNCIYSIDGFQIQPEKKKVLENDLTAGEDQISLFKQDGEFGNWPSLTVNTKPKK